MTSHRLFILLSSSNVRNQIATISTYLHNLLSDIQLLSAANALVAGSEIEKAREELAQVRPVLEKMKAGRDALEKELEAEEDNRVTDSQTTTKKTLSIALDRLAKGLPSVVEPSQIPMPTYPGFMGIFDYARQVRKALLSSLDEAIRIAEDDSRKTTTSGVDAIKQLAEIHLPPGVERNKRVFMPEAMFSSSRRTSTGGRSRRRSSTHGYAHSSASGRGTVVAGGMYGLGIGFAQRPDLLETTFLDLFDFQYHLWSQFSDSDERKKNGAFDENGVPSALSIVGLGLSALTMVGGQAVGVRGLIEGAVRITDLFGNETARKWAAPILGVFTVGLTAYVIMELPSSIPRTVGRRIRASIVNQENGEREDVFLNVHAERIGRETRKVLRLASWDLRQRFGKAMEARGQEVRGAEEMEKKASKAKEWFEGVGNRTSNIKVEADLATVV